MALCTRCGQQTEAGAEFCPACGGYAADGYSGSPTLAGAVAAAAAPVQHTSAAGPARDYPPPGRLRYGQSTADPDPGELWYPPSAPARSYRGTQPGQQPDDEHWPFGPDAADPAQPTAGPPDSRPAVHYAPRPFRLDAPGAIAAEPRPWPVPPPGLGSSDHAAGLVPPAWPGSHSPGQPAEAPAPAQYAAAGYAPPAHDYTTPDLLAASGQQPGPEAGAPPGFQAEPAFPAGPAFPRSPAVPAAEGTLLIDAVTTHQPAGPDEAGPAEAPAPGGDTAAEVRGSAPAHSRSPRSGRWIALVAALVVLIIAAATALLATANHGTAGHTPAAGRPRGSASPAARPSASSAARPSARASGLVRVTAAAAVSPRATHVVTFLNRYFDAINTHNFAAYRRLFTPSLRGGLSVTAFASGYGTTRDSAVTLRGVSATTAGEIQALVTFTSHQQVSESPTHSACTDWSIALYLTRIGGRYALATPPAGYSASDSACG